jgi:4-hydroxy-tetrahydrodipicolinate reductase
MNIAIVGHGKMGKAVEQVSNDRRHQVQIVPGSGPKYQFNDDISCVIEFTHASVAPWILRQCIDAGIPVVSGTTGWDLEKPEVFAYCQEHNGMIIWSPNFSIGMHIVFELNQTLARMMDSRPEYHVEILESHHTEKKDQPSGTAISLANQIIDALGRKERWQLKGSGDISESTLQVISERIPEVKGIHRITYSGPYDVISLRHKALSREAFAFGAVLSAEWLVDASMSGKRGVFTFSDVIKNG